MTEILLGAVTTLFGGLVTLAGLYRRLSTKKAEELAALNALLAQSADAHRATLERKEREKDALEKELRAMYERMLDAAYGATRGGTPRPHRGRPETLEERRERLLTVTGALSARDRAEYARRLAEDLPMPTGEVDTLPR